MSFLRNFSLYPAQKSSAFNLSHLFTIFGIISQAASQNNTTAATTQYTSPPNSSGASSENITSYVLFALLALCGICTIAASVRYISRANKRAHMEAENTNVEMQCSQSSTEKKKQVTFA